MARRSSAGPRSAPRLVEFDLEPFYETARLLYEGPWVAERYLVIRDLLGVLAGFDPSGHPRDHLAGARLSAADTFAALYRLQALRRIAERTFANIDALVLPTAPTAYRRRRCWPIRSNSTPGSAPTPTSKSARPLRAGAAAAIRPDDVPVRHHALGPAGQDALTRLDRPRVPCRHQNSRWVRAQPARSRRSRRCRWKLVLDEITHRGGRRASLRHGAERRIAGAGRTADRGPLRTAPDYQAYALEKRTPPKPGMLRVDAGVRTFDQGRAVGVVGVAAFGTFVAAIPAAAWG